MSQVWLHERAAMREDSGIVRVDADKLVFDELLWIWHAANPVLEYYLPHRCLNAQKFLEARLDLGRLNRGAA